MSGTRLPRNIFFALIFVALADAVYNFPLLPDRLASHFSAAGVPNGWMTKEAFFAVYFVAVLSAAAIEFLVPFCIGKGSSSHMNLPNKEYWLAPGRRAETIAYFEQSFAWYGCALLLFEVLAMGLAIQANFKSPPQLSAVPVMAVVVLYFLYTLIWVIRMVLRFSIIPASL